MTEVEGRWENMSGDINQNALWAKLSKNRKLFKKTLKKSLKENRNKPTVFKTSGMSETSLTTILASKLKSTNKVEGWLKNVSKDLMSNNGTGK